jgi:hypothetical protein
LRNEPNSPAAIVRVLMTVEFGTKQPGEAQDRPERAED